MNEVDKFDYECYNWLVLVASLVNQKNTKDHAESDVDGCLFVLIFN